jgi:hypothetical protein
MPAISCQERRGRPYRAFEHLGRAVLGLRYSPRSIFVMLSGYFDEAAGDDYGFTVVAGYPASVEQWDSFEIDWKLFLASYHVPYFHMSKFSQFKKPFHESRWRNSPAYRAKFLQDAADIIRSKVERGFSCYVDHDAFRRTNEAFCLSEAVGSAYGVAGRVCAALCHIRRRMAKRYEEGQYVFEDGGPDKGGLIKALDMRPKFPDPIFRPGRDIRDRKVGLRSGLVQLQAADFLAYEIRKFVADHPKMKLGERGPRASLGLLTAIKTDRRFYDYNRLMVLSKAGWKLKRR